MNTVEALEQEGLRKDLPDFSIGDTVDVTIKVVEGDRERTQVFSGTVIARKGSGIRQNFTVRKIVQGEGVERVFPLAAPSIVSIKVTRTGKVRRSKLYYLRKRVGKATKVKEAMYQNLPEGPAAAEDETPESTPEAPAEEASDEAADEGEPAETEAAPE